MHVYSIPSVIRLLRSYIDFRHYLLGQAVRNADTYAVPDQKIERRGELPLGQTKGDKRPWPFRELMRAKAPRDGKRRAQLMQDIHVSMIDLEEGLKLLSDDDLELIYKYHLFQTHTLEDLCAERGTRDRGAMSRRVERAVERLVRAMERPKR